MVDTTVCPFITMYLNTAQLVILSIAFLIPVICWVIDARTQNRRLLDAYSQFYRAYKLLSCEQRTVYRIMSKHPTLSSDQAEAIVNHDSL